MKIRPGSVRSNSRCATRERTPTRRRTSFTTGIAIVISTAGGSSRLIRLDSTAAISRSTCLGRTARYSSPIRTVYRVRLKEAVDLDSRVGSIRLRKLSSDLRGSSRACSGGNNNRCSNASPTTPPIAKSTSRNAWVPQWRIFLAAYMAATAVYFAGTLAFEVAETGLTSP